MDKLTQAKYYEWLISLTGACLVAFALGTWLGGYLNPKLILVVASIGVVLHGWGMYAMHQRNK